MVALAPNTTETSPWDVHNTFPKLHSRAREVKTRICTEAPYSKSLDCVEIWQVDLESSVGLESFTRDPIGYMGSPWDLYEFVKGRSVLQVDPYGLTGDPGGWDPKCPPCGILNKNTECCDESTWPNKIHIKRNQKQCCAAALAAGLNGSDGGGVICCDGREVSCAWNVQQLGDPSDKFIEDCMLLHEDSHHGAQPCIPICPGLARWTNWPLWNVDWEECNAYRIEFQCLKSKWKQCTTPFCRQRIDARKSQIFTYAYATYSRCDVTK